MIRISFSRPDDVDISGTPVDLDLVREELLSLIQEGKGEYSLNTLSEFDPEPYDVALTSLCVVVKGDLVKVGVENDNLIIEGGINSLKKFMECFDFRNPSKNEDHQHFEYEEDHENIHPDSISLVVRVI